MTSSLTAPTLWDSARAMFARMRAAVGEAAVLAARAWLSGEEQRSVRTWLSPLIAMVRMIVLIEAIALARVTGPLMQDFRTMPRKSKPGVRVRRARLRLWPKAGRAARVRQLGSPLLIREVFIERARAAAARRLKELRWMRPAPGVSLARRMEALTAILDRPHAAARRLARRLYVAPKLALNLIARKLPRTRRYVDVAYRDTSVRAFNDTIGWLYPNTS